MQILRVKPFSSSPPQFLLHLVPLWDYIYSLFFGVKVIVWSHIHKVVEAAQKSTAQVPARWANALKEKYKVKETKGRKAPKTCLVLKQFSLFLNHFGWRKHTETSLCWELYNTDNEKVWLVRQQIILLPANLALPVCYNHRQSKGNVIYDKDFGRYFIQYMYTYWLEVGQYIEDNQVIQKVKKGRNWPFHGITKILPGKAFKGMIQATLWK